MRIIGGIYRGKKLTAPDTLPVRPTTDFAKTGLFNILNHRYNFNNIKVLDLFAGTGSITFEFLSRGCSKITAVDRNAGCIKFINDTLVMLRAPSSVKPIQADALNWLLKTEKEFDIIFADPPFEMEIAEDLLKASIDSGKLCPGGILILEHQSLKQYNSLEPFVETRKYGNVSFTFFGDSK